MTSPHADPLRTWMSGDLLRGRPLEAWFAREASPSGSSPGEARAARIRAGDQSPGLTGGSTSGSTAEMPAESMAESMAETHSALSME